MDRRALSRLMIGLAIAGSVAPVLADDLPPARIGISLGLTGKYRDAAAMNKRGYELWRDDINARGGLLGRKVELIIVDDQSDQARARAIYQELTAGSNPMDHVFGSYSSELVEVIAPIVEAADYPLLAAGASADKLWEMDYRNLFAMLVPASRYTKGMLTLVHDVGITSFAILAADNAFARDVVDGTTKWAKYLSLKPVAQFVFPQSKPNLAAELRQVRAAKAELLVVAGFWDEAFAARSALSEIGWMPRAFYATIGPAFPRWHSDLGALGDGTFTTSTYEPKDILDYPGAREFDETFRSRFQVEPSYQAATAYAAGQILEAAAIAASSLDRDAIRQALSELDAYSIVGRFAVDHTGMQRKREEMIVQWQTGKKEIVWPDVIRTAEPVFAPPSL
jgi:branched-chain amino acid transport system substrate-binding protein